MYPIIVFVFGFEKPGNEILVKIFLLRVKLICNCPADKCATVETVTVMLTRHLQQIIVDKWSQVERQTESIFFCKTKSLWD